MLLNQNFETGLSAGVSAVLIAFGLAGGLVVANVLVPPAKEGTGKMGKRELGNRE